MRFRWLRVLGWLGVQWTAARPCWIKSRTPVAVLLALASALADVLLHEAAVLAF